MLLGMVLCVCAQNDAALQPGIGPRMNARERLQRLTLVTPAYRKEALRLLIEEVNRVAKELQLPEKLPITESNLTASYLSPPNMAGRVPGFGNISTSNYVYFVTVGNKFSFLERTHEVASIKRTEKLVHFVNCLGVQSQRENDSPARYGCAGGCRSFQCNRIFRFEPRCDWQTPTGKPVRV